MRRPSRSRPNWLTRRSQRLVAAEGAVVVEFDVPGERRGSRIRIEGQRHLRSEGVSVDAVLERDRRQLDVREQQVLAAVAEDDHCEVSRRLTCACVIVSMFRTHVPSTKYAGGFHRHRYISTLVTSRARSVARVATLSFSRLEY